MAALLAFLPDGYSRWFLPKEVVLVAAATAASLAVPAGRLRRGFWVLVGVGAAVLLVAALTSSAPLAQLLGRWPRYEGLVSVPVYVLAAWVGARLLGPGASTRRLRAASGAVGVASAVLFLVSLAESLGLRPIPSDLDRPGALLGNATDQGLVAAAFAVLLLASVVRQTVARAARLEIVLLAVGAAVAIATVALSGSRAGLLATGSGCLVLAVGGLLVLRGAAWRRALFVVVGSALGFGAVIVAVLPGARDRVAGTSPFASRTIADRLLIWQESLGLLADRPWLGVGPSGYADAIAAGHRTDWYTSVDAGTVLDSPHSLPLQLAVAGGVLLIAVGVAAAAWIIWVVVRRLRGMTDEPAPAKADLDLPREGSPRLLVLAAAAALTGLTVGLLTHFTSPVTGILGGMLVGVATATGGRAEAASGLRVLRAGGLAAWCVALAIITAAEIPVLRGLQAPDAVAADRAFAEARALRPWDPDLASIAAQSLTARADAGQPGAAGLAIQWADRALAVTPESAPAALARGVALRLAGDPEGSIAELDRLAKRLPADPDTAVQLALSLATVGRAADAEAEVQRALASDPDHPVATALVGRLGGVSPAG